MSQAPPVNASEAAVGGPFRFRHFDLDMSPHQPVWRAIDRPQSHVPTVPPLLASCHLTVYQLSRDPCASTGHTLLLAPRDPS